MSNTTFRLEPLLYILLGALLIFRPTSSLRVVTILVGITLVFRGLIYLFQMNRSNMGWKDGGIPQFWSSNMFPQA